jgi:hypothetical protein
VHAHRGNAEGAEMTDEFAATDGAQMDIDVKGRERKG